jgi:LysM repeat protein
MSILNTIESYRKRRKQLVPIFFGIVAVLLVIIGIILVSSTFTGGGFARLFASRTPTPTQTPLASNTPEITDTPTISLTPTETPTPTASTYWYYTVQEGDTLEKIATDQNLGTDGLVVILQLNPQIDPLTGFIVVGQKILLSPPNWSILTPTPLPTGLAAGARITYFVLPNDSLGIIARKFNSTENAILAANKTVLKDGLASIIYPGQLLIVPINIVTPVPSVTVTATASVTP